MSEIEQPQDHRPHGGNPEPQQNQEQREPQEPREPREPQRELGRLLVEGEWYFTLQELTLVRRAMGRLHDAMEGQTRCTLEVTVEVYRFLQIWKGTCERMSRFLERVLTYDDGPALFTSPQPWSYQASAANYRQALCGSCSATPGTSGETTAPGPASSGSDGSPGSAPGGSRSPGGSWSAPGGLRPGRDDPAADGRGRPASDAA